MTALWLPSCPACNPANASTHVLVLAPTKQEGTSLPSRNAPAALALELAWAAYIKSINSINSINHIHCIHHCHPHWSQFSTAVTTVFTTVLTTVFTTVFTIVFTTVILTGHSLAQQSPTFGATNTVLSRCNSSDSGVSSRMSSSISPGTSTN